MSKRVAFAVIMLCLILTLSGCEAGVPKTRKVLPEWSRGQQLGVAALNQLIDLVPEDNFVHLVWVAVEVNVPHYVRLDPSGQIELSANLDIVGAHPNDARLALNADDSLSILWTDNPKIPRALFLARVSRDGHLLSGPTQLSPEGVRVSHYTVVTDLDGDHHIFWANEIPSEGGIHHLQLSPEGQLASSSRLLIQNGESPTAQIALDGMLHLAWVVEPVIRVNYIYYAVLDPSTGQLGPETQVSLYKTATGLVSYPPNLALDNERVHLFWALEQRGGGLTPGEAKAFHVAFPLDNPHEMEPAQIGIPGLAKPVYSEASGGLPYQRLASVEGGWPTSVLYMPSTPDGQRQEVGVFLVGEVATQRESGREVVWAIYANGEIKGYQLPMTLGRTLRPTGVIDASGNVHLAWLNSGGFGRYEVYYASTSDAVKATLDPVTVQDRATDILSVAWAMAPALGFFPPVFLLWSFVSFIWIVLFYFVKVEGGLDRRPARIALVVAVLLYLFSKLFLMPGPLFYAPFQDNLPPNLQFVPVIGTPVFTLLVALGAVWIYFRRTDYRSLFAAYVIFVVTDAVLSLAIYVPRWLQG
jgi:hypothetical protein